LKCTRNPTTQAETQTLNIAIVAGSAMGVSVEKVGWLLNGGMQVVVDWLLADCKKACRVSWW